MTSTDLPTARGADGRPAERSSFETAMRARKAGGAKLVVPYVTGGMGTDWVEVLAAVVLAGADAVEVGIPFSDPVMDGPVIQEASRLALEAGATPASVLASAASAQVSVPVSAMTYYNIVFHHGLQRFAEMLAGSRFSGSIVPDLPLEEAGPWMAESRAAGLDNVLLVAPTTPPDRAEAICAAGSGFVYGVGLMGVTGERSELADSALEVARRLKAITDLPVLVGVGVTDAAQAARVCEVADGVIVGSALVRRLLSGEGAQGAGEFVAQLRGAVDRG